MKTLLVCASFVAAFAGVVAFEWSYSKDREGFWGGVWRMIDLIAHALFL